MHLAVHPTIAYADASSSPAFTRLALQQLFRAGLGRPGSPGRPADPHHTGSGAAGAIGLHLKAQLSRLENAGRITRKPVRPHALLPALPPLDCPLPGCTGRRHCAGPDSRRNSGAFRQDQPGTSH